MDNDTKKVSQPQFLFDSKASPNFDKTGQVFKETPRWTERISSAFASLFLWFKGLNVKKPEGERVRHIVKLIQNDEKISKFEKIAYQTFVVHQPVRKPMPFNDYVSSKEGLIHEAVGLVSGLTEVDKKYYQTSILEMMEVMDNVQDHPELASDTNRIFKSHNKATKGPFFTEDHKTVLAEDGEPKVKKFQKAITEDLAQFRESVRTLRRDIQQYQSLEACLKESPALGEQLTKDATALIQSCKKLMRNPAFKEYGWKTDLSEYLDSSNKLAQDAIPNKEIFGAFWKDIHRATYSIQDPSSKDPTRSIEIAVDKAELAMLDEDKKKARIVQKAELFLANIEKLVPGDDAATMDAMKCSCQALFGSQIEAVKAELDVKYGLDKNPVEHRINIGNNDLLPKSIPQVYYKINKDKKSGDLVIVAETIFQVINMEAIAKPEEGKNPFLGNIIMRVTIDRATSRITLEYSDVVSFVPVIEPGLAPTDFTKLKRWAVEKLPEEGAVAKPFKTFGAAPKTAEKLDEITRARIIKEIFSRDKGWIDKGGTKEHLSTQHKIYFHDALTGLLKISAALKETPPDAKKVYEAINEFNQVNPGEEGYIDYSTKDKAELESFAESMKTSLDKIEDTFSTAEKILSAPRPTKQPDEKKFTEIKNAVAMLFDALGSTLLNPALDQIGWHTIDLTTFTSTEKMSLTEDPNNSAEKIVTQFSKDIMRSSFYIEQRKEEIGKDPIIGVVALKNGDKTLDRAGRIKAFKEGVKALAPNISNDELLDAEAISTQSIINKQLELRMWESSGVKEARSKYIDFAYSGSDDNKRVIKKGEHGLVYFTEVVYNFYSPDERMFGDQKRYPKDKKEGTIGHLVARIVADQATGKISYEWSKIVDFEPALADGIDETDLTNLKHKPEAGV